MEIMSGDTARSWEATLLAFVAADAVRERIEATRVLSTEALGEGAGVE